MARLEQVVRPLVVRDVTPIPRTLVREEDDDKRVEIASSGGDILAFNHSRSWSHQKKRSSERREDAPAGKQQPKEVGRTVDIVRVFRIKDNSEIPGRVNSLGAIQPVPDESFIDRTQYIDIEHVTRLDLIDEDGEHQVIQFRKPVIESNMTLMAENVFKPSTS